MGIKSTYDIDRETAIQVILSKTYKCTNEQLADMLEAFPESHFRNYGVFDELPVEPDEYREQFVIRDITQF